MIKRGLLYKILILLIIIIGLAILVYLNLESKSESRDICYSDSDCVPAQACHPSSCVIKSQAPNSSGIFCTQECAPGTLDCGQGSCECINKKCGAVFR